MKVLALFSPFLITIWAVLVFALNIDLEPVNIKTDELEAVNINVAGQSTQIINMYNKTLSQRINVSNQQIQLLNSEIDNQDSIPLSTQLSHE